MNESELRITQAHAAHEHKGQVWGLDLALFPWMCLALLASLGLFAGLYYGAQLDFSDALTSAVVPAVLVILYLRLVHQGKPPGFTHQWLTELLSGGHAQPPRQSPPHPLDHD